MKNLNPIFRKVKLTPLFFTIIFFNLLAGNLHATMGLNYQAIARNSAGLPITNSQVTFRFTLHNDSATGIVAYKEEHTVTSDAFGIIAVVIGDRKSVV